MRITIGLTTCVSLFLLSIAGCSFKPETEVVPYPVTARQKAPEPTYSRVAWSHLPQPIPPDAPKRSLKEDPRNVPYFRTVMKVELERTTLGEAVQILAQTMGYDWSCPKEFTKKKVVLRTVGTVEDSLKEIEKQAGVKTELNHEQRIVRVIDKKTEPRLPR